MKASLCFWSKISTLFSLYLSRWPFWPLGEIIQYFIASKWISNRPKACLVFLFQISFTFFSWVRRTTAQCTTETWYESAVICTQSYKTRNLYKILGTRVLWYDPDFLGIWLRPLVGQHAPMYSTRFLKYCHLSLFFTLVPCKALHKNCNPYRRSFCVFVSTSTSSM